MAFGYVTVVEYCVKHSEEDAMNSDVVVADKRYHHAGIDPLKKRIKLLYGLHGVASVS